MKIIDARNKISKLELQKMAKIGFGNLVKAMIDVNII